MGILVKNMIRTQLASSTGYKFHTESDLPGLTD